MLERSCNTTEGKHARASRQHLARRSRRRAGRPEPRVVVPLGVPPLLVVVTGAPGAGKTTLARSLSAELQLPLLAKDDVKEALFDALGAGGLERSNELGAASFEVLFRLTARTLESGVSCIVEGNFSWTEPFRGLPPARIVQLLCSVPAELAIERYASRERHPGHVDDVRAGEVGARIEAGEWSALDIGGTLIELDTTVPVDVLALAQRLSR
ncbi:MAG: AAA family ATPase [Gaiellaceae bacterium]